MVWPYVNLLHLGDTPFLEVRSFSAIILLNKLSMPLVCTSSSVTPMIHSFGLFMVFQMSCMFYSYFLSILSLSFTLSLIPLCLIMFLILYFQFVPLCEPSFWLRFLFGILSCLFQVSISLLISSFISWIIFLFSFIYLFVLSLILSNYLFMSSLRSNPNFVLLLWHCSSFVLF
jgi:hypothetical protein